MKQELQEKLFEKYPKIFAEKDLPMQQTCMCWGISTGDGWYWLIDNLCEALQHDIDRNNYSQIKATQVKEKFGGLRFYVNGASNEQYAIISFAEGLSYSVCEQCGSTKDVKQTKGWIISLCPECMEKKNGK
jgi:hypothetical protein